MDDASILNDTNSLSQFDLPVFLQHGVYVEIVNLSAWGEVEPGELEPIEEGGEEAIFHLQFQIEDHFVVCLSDLEDVELIGAVLALAGADGVRLHAALVPNLPSRMLEA